MRSLSLYGVEMTEDESKRLIKFITDMEFTTVYLPFLIKLEAANTRKILKHNPDKDGMHEESVLKGMNLQIARETTEIRKLIDSLLTSSWKAFES